jgi:hypothetical protein
MLCGIGSNTGGGVGSCLICGGGGVGGCVGGGGGMNFVSSGLCCGI